MKVGFDVTPLLPPRSGIGRYTLELYRALAERYPEVELRPLGNRGAVGRELRAVGGMADVRLSGPRFPLRAVWMQAVLPYWLPFSGLDLCHFTNYYAPLAAGTPIVATFHDVSPLTMPEFHPGPRVVASRIFLGRIAAKARAVIAVSQSARRDLVKVLGLPEERVHVVYEAPSPQFQPVRDDARTAEVLARHHVAPGYLLYVGTVEPRKNLVRAIEAVGQLAGTGTPATLVIAGRLGWKYRPILARVEELGLGNRVRFLGFVPDADLPVLMSAATAFVYASLLEGFGLPVVEAMACGTPVVTSSGGATEEVAGGAALLVDPLDVAAIADGLARVLGSAGVREEMRGRGLARASQFSWARAAHDTAAVYRSALQPVGAAAPEALAARPSAPPDGRGQGPRETRP